MSNKEKKAHSFLDITLGDKVRLMIARYKNARATDIERLIIVRNLQTILENRREEIIPSTQDMIDDVINDNLP